jgi:CRP-like cAMP-binding protein
MTTTPSQKYFRNRLITAMSLDDFALLQPHLELVSLEVQQVLVQPNAPIEHVYFLEHGIVSLVAVNLSGERIEVGNVGREGLAGISIVNHVRHSPLLAFVQVAGPASRMPASDLL